MEESASMKLVMKPGPPPAEKKARMTLSAAQQHERHMKKVEAAAATPEGLLLDQSTAFGMGTVDTLAQHIEILKPAMEKMRETYPATFAFMRYQWSRLPPSMRVKMISQSSDYAKLYDDPEMRPFTEWMRKLEGSGSVENQLRRVARRAVMGEKMRLAELWQETDAALAEMRSEEKVLDLLVPSLDFEEREMEEILEEASPEDNTPEGRKELWEDIQELVRAESDDPELHLMLHYMVNGGDAVDPSGNMQRIFDPDELSEVDMLEMVDQRAKLNRILLGFKRNLLAEMPELERQELLETYKDALVEPTDPAEKAAWDARMAHASEQLEAAHRQGLTSHTSYRNALEDFKQQNQVDFVPNPVAIRLLLDSMQEVVDDYNPELRTLITEMGPDQAEESLIERGIIDLERADEEEDENFAETLIDEPLDLEELDEDEEHVSDAEFLGDLLETIEEADEDDVVDALHPDYADVVLKEFLEPLVSWEVGLEPEARQAMLETYEAHLDSYINGTPLDAKYVSDEDKEFEAAFAASPEQAMSLIKRVLHLPDTNVRDLSRAILLDHTRAVAADLGLTMENDDITGTILLEQFQRIRHEVQMKLNTPGVTEEEKAELKKALELVSLLEVPSQEGEDYFPVGDPHVQFEEMKTTLAVGKDLMVEYNAELNQWEATIDSVFSKAREVTHRMLDPANASKNPSWVKQLKEMHEKVYGSALPNPLASVTSDDLMAEWSRAVKEELMFEEARDSVQRERDAVKNQIRRQLDPLTTARQPEVSDAEHDPGYYPFSTSDIQAERPLEERIYLPQDLDVDQIFTEANVGRYLTFSDRDLNKYLPEGFSLHLTRREFAETKTKSILIRKQALEAIANLKAQQAAGFIVPRHKASIANDVSVPKPMMLHGHVGVGKSAVMSEVVYWARRSGWLVVYIPDGNAYLSSGVYISKNQQEGTWDQPKLFVRMFSHLAAAHPDKLKEIPLSTPVKVGKITAKTLYDVVEYGSVLEQYAAQCFAVFKQEIKKVTQFPVLMAFDCYNALYTPSQTFRDPESSSYYKDPLNPYNMTLGRMFYDAHVDHKLANGTFIGALSESVPLRAFVNHKVDPKLHAAGSIVQPKYLAVQPYTKAEFTTVMEHYKHKNWVRTQMSSGSASELYIYQLTSGFPGAIWSYAKRL